ncbi:predicted protein [Bathycoccus prasinos]|uniref:Uncharacterized protein n=1 Tax=Bathycoccus prasinos TaxID=41875 RepID=K8EP57_9CHLO|nr:predicted protein [Bathycoccus prasinos]CCO20007.1 predicted protein [Bathycoccus prasinos]|eukprot:XP_007508921.1 predicted protein [Bathycoccus prasinos]
MSLCFTRIMNTQPLAMKLREINQSEDGGRMPKLASAVTHQYVLKHQSSLVVAYASACASEVFRIFAPEQPYEKEETLRAVYENFNQTLGWLKYASSSSSRRKKDHDDEDEDDENEDDEDEDDEGEKEEKEEEEEDGKKLKKKNSKKSTKKKTKADPANPPPNLERKRILFEQSERLLRNIAQYGLCVPVLDLEDKSTSVELAKDLFETLFDATTAKTEPIIGENVARVLNTMIEERGGGYDVLEHSPLLPEILEQTLSRLVEPKKSQNPSAHALSSALVVSCSTSLHVPTQKFLVKSIRNLVPKNHALFNLSKKHAAILEALASVDAAVLSTLWPELHEEARSEEVAQRLKACALLGRVLRARSSTIRIANNGNSFGCIADEYPHVLKMFCERFSDKERAVRVFCCNWALNFLNNGSVGEDAEKTVTNETLPSSQSSSDGTKKTSDNSNTISRLSPKPSGETNAAAVQVFEHLRQRCKDPDEHVRLKATEVLFEIYSRETDRRAVQLKAVKESGERALRDRRPTVRKAVVDGMVKCYRNYALRCMKKAETLRTGGEEDSERFDWIPGTILKGIVVPDIAMHVVEPALANLFPASFPADARTTFWLRALMTSGSALAKSAEDVVDVEDGGKETTIINYVEPRVRDCLKMFLYRREIARKDFKEYMDARELAKGKTSPKNSEKQLSEARVFFSKNFRNEEKSLKLLETGIEQVKDQKFFKSLITLANLNTSQKDARLAAEDAKKRLGEKHGAFQLLEAMIAKIDPSPFDGDHARCTLKMALKNGKKPTKRNEIDENNRRVAMFAMDHAMMLAEANPSIFNSCGDLFLKALSENAEVPPLVDDVVTEFTRLFSVCGGHSLASVKETSHLRDLLVNTVEQGASGWTRSKLAARSLVQLASSSGSGQKKANDANVDALESCFSNLLDALADGRDAEMPNLLAAASAMPPALVFKNLDAVENALFSLVENESNDDFCRVEAIKCLRNFATFEMMKSVSLSSKSSTTGAALLAKVKQFKKRAVDAFVQILESSENDEVLRATALAIPKIASGGSVSEKVIDQTAFYAVAKFLCDNDDDDETKLAFVSKISKYSKRKMSSLGVRWHAIVACLTGNAYSRSVRDVASTAWEVFATKTQRNKFELFNREAVESSKDPETTKSKKSFAFTRSPEYTLVYLIHLLSRVQFGVTSAKDEDGEFDALTAKDLRFSEGVFEHAVHALWPPVDRKAEKMIALNSLVASTLKLIRGVKTCEDAEDADGKTDALYLLTDLCLLACKSVCAKRGFDWMDDRSSESALLQITAVYPSTLYTVVGRRASGKPLEVGGPPRIGDCSHLPRAYLKAQANGGKASKSEYYHHDRSRNNATTTGANKRPAATATTTTTTASNAKVTDAFGGGNLKKQKTLKQTTLKMENPSRAMPKRKATGQAIIVDELYDSDEFEPDSAVKKQKKLALPAPESRFVVPPSPAVGLKSRSTNTTGTTTTTTATTSSKSNSLKQKNVTSFFGVAREDSDVENLPTARGGVREGTTALALVDPIKRGRRRR